MTLPTPELGLMKQDMSGLIMDWGVSCVIKRKGATKNTAGQVSAAFATVGTETMWIQPYEGQMYREREPAHVDAGVLDRMTHQAYERFSGTAVQADDQITAAGDSYVYDVLAQQVVATHRHLFLQQVKRS